MQMLYEITIPGLSVRADLPAIRRRLRADFPQILDVLATTTPATLLIVYSDSDEIDVWLAALSDCVGTGQLSRACGTGTGTASSAA
jgi:hypothetical protein